MGFTSPTVRLQEDVMRIKTQAGGEEEREQERGSFC